MAYGFFTLAAWSDNKGKGARRFHGADRLGSKKGPAFLAMLVHQ